MNKKPFYFDKVNRQKVFLDSHFGVKGQFGGSAEIFESHIKNMDDYEILDEKAGVCLIKTLTKGKVAFFLGSVEKA